MGSNLAMIGSELIQFGSAVPLSPGRFAGGGEANGRLESTSRVKCSC